LNLLPASGYIYPERLDDCRHPAQDIPSPPHGVFHDGFRADLDLIRCIAACEDAALRLTGDPTQAEDILQDALVLAWRSAGRFCGEERVPAWLIGIVHHPAMKSLRRGPQSLSPEHRAVLKPVFYQQFILEEAAAVYGCPLGTTKNRLSYARRCARSWDAGQD
jgi:RNA polymerase sigma-70 factor (ECF subfamily)